MLERIILVLAAIFISYFITAALGIGEIGWPLSYIAVVITFKFIGIGEGQKK